MQLLAQSKSAQWIGADLKEGDTTNIWTAYKKTFQVSDLPRRAVARIAVDSKYWLYLNGKLVVFEGGLKRGPNPKDTYVDEVDLLPYLVKGQNHIAIQVWYFGKQGFSHNSSGKAGLFFDLKTESFNLHSDKSWYSKRQYEYKTAADPIPNFRLPESNILYDARIAQPNWYKAEHKEAGYTAAKELGTEGAAPWNKLIKRPIPLWKDFGLKDFAIQDISRSKDTIRCKLPYNMQFTPYLDIEAEEEGLLIKLFTDNYTTYNGSTENIRAEYITRKGRQTYESLGWQNGHYMFFVIPAGVKVHGLKYRETGYDTEFDGTFTSSDAFLNKLWQKANRTLYVTMRDTYMDCPDRERAQWTGDAVLEAQEAFYALSPSSHALAKKWLYELVGWQKPDGVLFAPIPAGNWDKELPDQVMASVGFYGLWTYYMHTGDRQALVDLYPGIQRYIKLWEKDQDGLVLLRAGGWQWGDWGDNKDMLLLYNLWYYLGIEGSYLMAKELGKDEDAAVYLQEMKQFEITFNQRFWDGKEYRDPAYKGKTDDRVHALAVLTGIAKEDKYPQILDVFATQAHASPYMEKYVYEAMYKMKQPVLANERHKRRFAKMVNNDYFTTLFEGWGIGGDGFGGGTVNHAWSGGGLTILSSELCGIKPILPGYTKFKISPQIGDLAFASAKVASVKGNIEVAIRKENAVYSIDILVPDATEAVFVNPYPLQKEVLVNQVELQQLINLNKIKAGDSSDEIVLSPGYWNIKIRL